MKKLRAVNSKLHVIQHYSRQPVSGFSNPSQSPRGYEHSPRQSRQVPSSINMRNTLPTHGWQEDQGEEAPPSNGHVLPRQIQSHQTSTRANKKLSNKWKRNNNLIDGAGEADEQAAAQS